MYTYRWLRKLIIHEYLLETESIHERSKIILLFNIAYAVSIMGVIAMVVSLIIGTYPVLVPAVGNLSFGITALIFLKKFGLKTAAVFYFIVLFVLLFGNLNFNPGTMHIGSPFWIMLLNILVLYILGLRWWGIIFLALSVFGFMFYLQNVLPKTVEILPTLSPETYYSAYYETVFALFLLGYIIHNIIQSSKESDTLLMKQNKELTEQYGIVKRADEEKTVMLKEIHHRVKNNLQVIISLLRLQMKEIEDPTSHEKFKDSINRVLTMAMIHEKIYQAEELSRINIEKYFASLAKDLITSYEIDKQVELKIDMSIDKMGLKSIVPLALIFNELLSNSLKHAFHKTSTPEIRLSLRKIDSDNFSFEFSDNGLWREPTSNKGFGVSLIESMTDQLEGQMVFRNEPSVHYQFIFPHLELE